MFKGFDYGKGLSKQLDAYKRLPAAQRPRREAKLNKQFDTFCRRFLEALNNSGSANPGQLRNAAEIIIQTAKELGITTHAYGIFAEMVARSRKVPVIPGLAGLVDCLLEQETESRTERLSLLNWRITTGNMRVDRYLDYQCQRARLSNDSEHWKDYCWGLIQLVQKGTIKPQDGPALQALELLQKRHHELGDKIADVMMLLAEARFAQQNFTEMEKCLLEIATRTSTPPKGFYELLDMLLGERADACWELHQMALNHALRKVADGKMGWSDAETVIIRARKYKDKRLDYLLEHELMVKLEPLGHYVLETVLNLPDSKVHQTLLRWRYAFSSRGVDMPDSIRRAYTDAKEQGYTGMDSIPTVVMPNEEGQEEEVEPVEELQLDDPEFIPEPPEVARAVEGMDYARELAPLHVAPEVENEFADAYTAEDSDVPELAQQPEYPEEAEEQVPEITTAEQLVEQEAPVAVEPEAEPAPLEEIDHEPTLVEHLLKCANAKELKRELTAAYPLSTDEIDEIEKCLTDTRRKRQPWLAFEVRLELAKWYMVNRDTTAAEDELKMLEVPLGTSPKDLVFRIHSIFGDSPPDTAAKLIVEAHLNAGDFLQAMECAIQIHKGETQRSSLEEIQVWLLEQTDATPLMEITAAEIQRKLSGDPAAELETAVRASLLAPDYEPVQRLYTGWLEAVPTADINIARATIASRLCCEGPSERMARTAAQAIADMLEIPGGDEAVSLARDLAIELRPALEEFHLIDELTAGTATETEEDSEKAALLAEAERAATEGWPEFEEAVHEVDEEPETEADNEVEAPPEEVGATVEAIDDAAVAALEEEMEMEPLFASTELQAAKLTNGHVEGIEDQTPSEQPEAEPAHATVGAAMSVEAAHGEVNWSAVTTKEIAGRLSSGDWHGAGLKAGRHYGSADGDSTDDLTGIYHSLPTEAMLPFSEGLAQAYGELEEYSKLFDVLNLITGELNNGKRELRHDTELQSFIDGTLHSLCERAFEERFNNGFEFTAKTDSGRQTINDLLILARSGDKNASLQLHKAFVAILKEDPRDSTLQVIADVLAPMLKESAPQQSLKLVAQAGLAVNDSRWALSRIDDLGLNCTEAESCFLLGRLYLAKSDLQMSFAVVEKLISMGDSTSARDLLTQLSEPSAGKLDSMIQLTRMFVLLDPPDYESAFDELLEIYRLASEGNINLSLALSPLAALTDEKACTQMHSPEVCKFQLLLYSILGEAGKVLWIVEKLHGSDAGGAEKLLRAVDKLAMQDNAIPPLTVIGWAKALLLAGRTAEALDKLAGIAESGVEYQAYTRLLEEAKRDCESPDANMQLAQAYLRNHLWMRSAEEYRQALVKDAELCEPILTQLKRWGALELDPIKHPIHFLAVQATSLSSSPENWSWALEALPWLRESWPPKKLHELALSLWENRERTNLDNIATSVLVEQLIGLAIDSNNIESATALLVEVWEPGSKLAQAMRPVVSSIEKRLRTANEALLFRFKKILLEDAIAENDAERMNRTADELAAVSEQGRLAVISLLCGDELPDEIAGAAGSKALEFLHLDEPREQQEFMKLLKRLHNLELPINVTRMLIHSAVSLMRGDQAGPELESSVFGLLRTTRDDQRSSGLAAYFAQPGQPLAEEATELIAELGFRNHSQQHYLSMAEICLNNGSEGREAYEWLAKAGAKLDYDFAQPLLALAHSLAGTTAAAAGHAGLSLYYRKAGDHERAAREMFWAHQAGSEVDMSWLANADTGNLGFYSALLLLAQDRQKEAVDRLKHVVEDGAADADHSAAARMTMAQLALDRGRKAEAFSLAESAKAMSPSHPLANEMINSLKQDIFLERLQAAKDQVESAERTLVIAQLHKENGQVNEAINELQAGIRKGFANENVFLELAECFAVAGQHNISRRAYFEALKRLEQRNGDSELMVRALYGLAQEDIQLGNQDEAISNLEYLQLIKSDYRDAQELIEKLYKAREASLRPNSQDVASQVLEQIMTLLGKDEQAGPSGEA